MEAVSSTTISLTERLLWVISPQWIYVNIWIYQLNTDFHSLPSVASFMFNYKKFLISVHLIYISRPTLYGYFYVWLIDYVSSKIVPLENELVICGANAHSLLLVVLFISRGAPIIGIGRLSGSFPIICIGYLTIGIGRLFFSVSKTTKNAFNCSSHWWQWGN